MSRIMLRHLVATLAYRAAKVLRDAPADFGTFQVAVAARRPVQIVAHMADLMSWAVTLANGEYVWKAEGGEDWNTEVARFFDRLAALDAALDRSRPAGGRRGKAHPGAARRCADPRRTTRDAARRGRRSGATGKLCARGHRCRAVGMTQAAPVTEFDGDASAPQ